MVDVWKGGEKKSLRVAFQLLLLPPNLQTCKHFYFSKKKSSLILFKFICKSFTCLRDFILLFEVDSLNTHVYRGFPSCFILACLHTQILLTDHLTFPWGISWENSIKDQRIFPFINSHNFFSWLYSYNVWRKWMLVTLGSQRVRLETHATRAFFSTWQARRFLKKLYYSLLCAGQRWFLS